MLQESMNLPPMPITLHDAEAVDRIRKLSSYVARNGKEFEEKVRVKEANNDHFNFLNNSSSEEYQYYQWILHCIRYQPPLSTDQIKIIEDTHATNLKEYSIKGSVDLTMEDKLELQNLLASNTGSKDCIKSLRRWILDRSHSIIAIILIIKKFIQSCSSFNIMLYTIYAINDIFYNTSTTATTRGPYTRLLTEDFHKPVDIIHYFFPHLSSILRTAYQVAEGNHAANGDEAVQQKEKVVRVIELWQKKDFIDNIGYSMLISSLTHTHAPPDPPTTLLLSPYPIFPVSSSSIPSTASVSNQSIAPVLLPPYPSTNPPPNFNNIINNNSNIYFPLKNNTSINSNTLPLMGNLTYPLMNQPSYPQPIQVPFNPFDLTVNMNQPPMHSAQQQSSLAAALSVVSAINNKITPLIDLGKISVGGMTNIIKAAIKTGHPKYFPIDVSTLTMASNTHVEPGRLEARVTEYYRKVHLILENETFQSSQPTHKEDKSSTEENKDRPNHRNDERRTRSDSDYENNWEKLAMKSQQTADSTDSNRNNSRNRARSITTSNNNYNNNEENVITEENMGHKLLRGLGWQQGSGLGAENSGIVEPIREVGKKDKDRIGLGGGADRYVIEGDDPNTQDFSSYRKQLSSIYHSSRRG
eukprot:gene7897-10719_t